VALFFQRQYFPDPQAVQVEAGGPP
jgi:hypothetical protein